MSADRPVELGGNVSKIRHHRRIMPSNGRMENGTFKPDYWQGRQDALGEKFREHKGKLDVTPMCLTSRSRDYWIGYRQGYQERHGHAAPKGLESMTRSRLNALVNQQKQQLTDLCREQGLDISKYIQDGGDLSHLLFCLGAKEA